MSFLARNLYKRRVVRAAIALLFMMSALPTFVYSQHRPRAHAHRSRETVVLAYQFTPASRLVYSIEFQTESVSDFNRALKGPTFSRSHPQPGPETVVMSPLNHSFRTYLGGEWTMTVLKKTDEGFLVAYSMQRPIVELPEPGADDRASAEILLSELAKPVFVSVSTQGRILSLTFDPTLHSITRNFIKATLAITQFVLPDEKNRQGVSQWQDEEEDGNGRYLAGYSETNRSVRRAVVQRPVRMFRKTKIRYLPPLSSQSRKGIFELAPAINSAGGFAGQVDVRDGHLLSLKGTETQAFLIAGHFVGQTQTHLTLQFTNTEFLDPAAITLLLEARAVNAMGAAAVSLSTRPSEEELETALQKSNLGRDTLETLIAALQSVQPATRLTDTQLYLKLRALVHLRPDASVSLGKILGTAEAGSRTVNILIDALGAVGHDEAQAALVNAIRVHNTDVEMLPKLVLALDRSMAPSQLSEDALRELAANSNTPEIAQLSLFLLGNVANKVAQTSPERSTKIVNSLIRDTAETTSPEVLKGRLLALGATRSAVALKIIAGFLYHPSAEIRAVAASALRLFPVGTADELLLKVLATDMDATVRNACAEALGERGLTQESYQVQSKVFDTEPAENVRLTLLNNLWQGREAFPAVVNIIKRAAQKDPSMDVRESARSLITRK